MAVRWEAGTHVVVRNVWHGRVFSAYPLVVVEDTADLVVLFIPAGAVWKKPVRADGSNVRIPHGDWTLQDDVWYGHGALRFFPTAEAHAVLAWRGPAGIARWYINLESRCRRTPLGWDMRDHFVDIDYRDGWHAPRLKDQDELVTAHALGVVTACEVRRIQRDVARALTLVQHGHPAIAQRWETWEPPPHWTVPTFPAGWEQMALDATR